MQFNNHPAAGIISKMVKDDRKAAKDKAAEVALDAASAEEAGSDAADYTDTDVALKAVAAVQEWAESADMDEGEGSADRLYALLIGIADADMDGEISEDEQGILDIAGEAAWDYMASKGVSDEDISKVLNDWDNEAAANVQEMVASNLPDGEEAAAEEMDNFVFGDGSDESALDAVYKKKIVIRKGKKMRINKRVSGRVRLSAKQKVGIRKMLRKSHSAKAQVRRAKSMKIRRKSIGG